MASNLLTFPDMTNLKIASTLSFPIDAATQTFAFIGRKGSGKTYGTGKLVELLIGAGVQVAILDTVGNWYGLRLAADGKSAGIDIPILGGLRGDIPLEATGGALIADALVESGRSMIIDISQFSKADRQRFALALGERLWKRKKAEAQPTPVHLVLEESQLIVPEAVRGDSAAMVGIYEEIIRLGRNYGIGVTMITQRPQSVNKEVLNQTECLMVFQTNGAHERKALREWIVHQGMDVKLLEQLPSLQPGECFVWSPQWLQVLQKIHISEKQTFDSTSTPKIGKGTLRARELRQIDLDALKTKMAATIERAKAEDPRELRKRITALERELEQERRKAPAAEPIIRIPVLTPEQERRLDSLADVANLLQRNQESILGLLRNEPAVLQQMVDSIRNLSNGLKPIPPRPTELVRPRTQDASSGKADMGAMRFAGGLRRMLIALAQRPQGLSAQQLGVRAGLSSKSGTFTTYMGRARSSDWINGSRNHLVITDAGLKALGEWDPLPTGSALLQYWLGQLGSGGASRMLQALADAYPNSLTKQELAQAAGMTGNSGTFTTYLGRLRSLELIEGSGQLRASEELFD